MAILIAKLMIKLIIRFIDPTKQKCSYPTRNKANKQVKKNKN